VNNPIWNNLLKKYKVLGFQIIGISLDDSILRWRKAIKDDKLEEWLHVSDLELGYYGKNALKYGIESIPYNVLIDSTGKILKKKITPEKLEELLMKE
jgi:alkyl hydroperoxide reductase subunit AhpC